jgi:hypothetical protein
MHQPVKDNLEEYLNRHGEREMPGEMAAHLQACLSCAKEFEQIEKQSFMLRDSLRTDCEPRPGFYARVMDRIDRQTDNSIWAVLLRPAFGRRIAIASAALVMLLGSYLVTSERSAPAPAQQEVSQESTLPQQRDAVLVNLASYHE